jgi:hypothetical protein
VLLHRLDDASITTPSQRNVSNAIRRGVVRGLFTFRRRHDDYTDAAHTAKKFINRRVISNVIGFDDFPLPRPHRGDVMDEVDYVHQYVVR